MAVCNRFHVNTRIALQMTVLLLPLLCTFAFLACTEDAPNTSVVSHEFTWEVDTIMPQSWQYLGQTLWGTSANNVFLGAFNSDGHESLVHWDGKKWTPIDLWHFGLGGNITMIDGLDSSFFIAIGDGGLWGKAARYADGRWDTLRLPRTRPYFTCVDVVSRNEIYIGCVDGILKHDGTNCEWLLDSTDQQQSTYNFWPISILKTKSGELLFTSQRDWPGDGVQISFWKHQENRFAVVDSFRLKGPTTIAKFGTILVNIGNGVYSANYGLFKYDNMWVKISDLEGRCIAGEQNNLFVGWWNYIYHYNGTDWQEILPKHLLPQPMYVKSLFYSGGTIFIGFDNGFKSFVLRGKQR